MDKRKEILKVLLFVTRPKSTKEIHSPSSTVQMFPGRRKSDPLASNHHLLILPLANFGALLGMEIESKMGAIAVTVCGSGSLSDDVRRAVRDKQSVANIDFIEEAFSW